mgnify:CR=1 FL=1
MEKVAIDFAKKVGKYQYKELESELSGVSFMQAFTNLNGYNLDEVEIEIGRASCRERV